MGQSSHTLAPCWPLKVPLTQALHSPAPAALQEPSGQGAQRDWE